MSEENLEAARQVIQAFNRRDLATMTESFDPGIEWAPVGPAAVGTRNLPRPRRGSRRVRRDLGRMGGVRPRGARGS